MKEEKYILWECPMCKYVIENVKFQALRLDLGCPKCKRMRLADFHLETLN